MADVRITYSPDKVASASRLSEAVSAAGYTVASQPIADLEDMFAAADGDDAAAATLFIWSRPLVSSALQPDLLRRLRQQPNLIEVSTDGITPLGAGSDSRVILLSGWRGQPFHPGWQKVAGTLKRLCGEPASVAPAARRSSPKAPPPPPKPPRAPAERQPAKPGSRRMIFIAIGAVGLVGAALGAATLIGRSDPAGQNPPPRIEAPAAPPAALPQSNPATAAPGPTLNPSPPAPSPQALVPPPGAPEAAPEVPERPKTAPSKAKAKAAKKAKESASSAAAKKRYSRRNSATMRLFCEGSGRTTPQCRTFLRSTGTGRR